MTDAETKFKVAAHEALLNDLMTAKSNIMALKKDDFIQAAQAIGIDTEGLTIDQLKAAITEAGGDLPVEAPTEPAPTPTGHSFEVDGQRYRFKVMQLRYQGKTISAEVAAQFDELCKLLVTGNSSIIEKL